MNSPEAIAFAAFAFVLVKVLGPIAVAIGDRMRRRKPEPDPRLTAEVDEMRTRLAEVEERLDFAERLLARNEPDQIRGGVNR